MSKLTINDRGDVTIDDSIHPPRFKDGRVECRVYFCPIDMDLKEDYVHVIEGIYSGDITGILFPFNISEILDLAIDFKQIPKYGNRIGEDDRPFFDALKNELQSMIDRIDSLEFQQVRDEDFK